MTELDLLQACQRHDRRAQQLLYDRYAPLLFGVCKRYVKSREDAEDVLVEAFYKILTNIHYFKNEGSLEGWMRRIVVNEALMFLRKQHNFNMTVEINTQLDTEAEPLTAVDELAAQDILDLLDGLPTGYRTVFNLYVIEGYKHREIADLLGISIHTSKSQLILAKKKLQDLLEGLNYPGVRDMNTKTL
jgi:RNA polymerase sigma-70 factor (ECF subfamily)